MTRDDIIRMAREAGMAEWHPSIQQHLFSFAEPGRLEHFAALVAAAEREKVAAWIIAHFYATGHGDTTEDMLEELEWQIAERERKACADIAAQYASCEGIAQKIEQEIRERGEK